MKKTFFVLVLLIACCATAHAQIGSRTVTFTTATSDVGLGNIGSGIAYHQLSWNVVGGTLSACTVALDSSADNITFSAGGVITGQTCTTTGQSTVVNATVNYVRITVTTKTTATGTPSLVVIWNGWNANPAGGGGGSVTLETNNVSNTDQTTLNFLTSTVNASGLIITPSNPSGGEEKLEITGTPTTASAVPMNNVVSATGAITPIAIGANTLPFTCAQTSTPDCVTIEEATATPFSVGTSHLLLIEQLTGSNATPFTIYSAGLNAATGHNAAPAVFVQGINGGLAGASQNGFNGSDIQFITGDGSNGGATTGNGGTGGNWQLGGGNGGNAGGTSSNAGGNGGQWVWNLGSGGNGGATGNGGNAGSVNFNGGGGTGGNGGATSGTGGKGGTYSFAGGAGGTAVAGSTTGAGGDFNINPGLAGTGGGTPGAPGRINIGGATVFGANTTDLIDVVQIWNTTGIIDGLLDVRVTDTASNAASLLQDWYVNNISQYKLSKTGTVTIPGQFASTVATGTPPLSVVSTDPVAHLAAGPTTYNHSGTQLTNTHIVQDSCILGTSCSVTLTGSAVFTSSTSYTCVAQDATAINATRVNQTSGSAFAITGTGTDTIFYSCVGN